MTKQVYLLLYFLLAICLVLRGQSNGKAPDKKYSLHVQNESIGDILKQFSEKEHIDYSFGGNELDLKVMRTLNLNNLSLENILKQVFQGTNIAFQLIDNQIILKQISVSSKFTISGYIKEKDSEETLLGVNIYCPKLKVGTTSNNYGFYSLTLNIDQPVEIQYSFVGYTTSTIRVNPGKNQELNIELEPGTLLNEVVVNAETNNHPSENVQMSKISVPVTQIKSIPSLLGEKDVFKVLQLMPGVQKGMEGSSGIYVRGGGPDQNLIILDDAIVYNASHLFGFFSLFNGDALKSVELTKGGFPARYGGRLSSVVEMNMKEGNKETWHGEGGIGLISSRMTVEGPLKKNKSSILLSGRRTYMDLVTRPLTRSMDGESAGYYFYDFNAKINYDFGRANKVYLSGYFGKDLFSIKQNEVDYEDKSGFHWGNGTATLRWNHLYSEKIFSNLSMVYSRYNFNINENYKVKSENKDYYAAYNSGIRDITIKYDVDYLPDPKNAIKGGICMIQHRFKPYAFVEEDHGQNNYTHAYEKIDGLEGGLYLEDTYQPLELIKINAGLRYSVFFANHKHYNYLEPRLSVACIFPFSLAVKASYTRMNQYVHLLSNSGISLPTDLWVPCNDQVGPEQSDQIALGVVKDLFKSGFSISLEGYYKEMHHILNYKEGATYLSLDDASSGAESKWAENVTSGKGWSYGAEIFIQKKTGRFSGWMGYTLSWTQLQFDSLNFGKKFYARYDRRHDFSLVGIYKLNKKITCSFVWIYGTGNAISLSTDEFPAYIYQPENIYTIYHKNSLTGIGNFESLGERNNFRMEAYHRLDLGIQFHKQKSNHERIWEISCYNVYNRKNPFFYYQDTDNNHKGVLKKISLFPIIPTITYSFKF